MRKFQSYPLDEPETFAKKLLFRAPTTFKKICYIDNAAYNHQQSKYKGDFSYLIGVGAEDEININDKKGFHSLKTFYKSKKDWLFGFLSYDLKNETEDLTSDNPDGIRMPLLHFFQPKYIFIISNNQVKIGYLENSSNKTEIEELFKKIQHSTLNTQHSTFNIQLQPRISEEQYLNAIKSLKHHIKIGDIYEVNFCQEFYAENVLIEPLQIYLKLNEISPMPFSCFYRLDDKYLMCASPERFLRKTGNKIISQPIKGTIKKGRTPAEDDILKQQLLNSQKEKSENVMIVDLVRNDLSRTAKKRSVKVEELFGIYSFRQVHQMISTITSELREDVSFTDVIKYAFPMGSMTGAPKIRAMQLIEQYENTKRGLFSGAVGYITPDADFDFNVVIRSILYNATKQYLSLMVGGAITDKSIPENEYEECLLKAKAMFNALDCFK